MATAVRRNSGWTLSAPEPVGDTSNLLNSLGDRRELDGAVLIGFDFPIGLPAQYGAVTGFPDFKSALASFGHGNWREWYDVCESREEISINRPFYPMRTGGRSRDHLTERLGLDWEQLLRQCEKATNARPEACCLFWTLGGNQVGKGAIEGWREVIAPNIESVKIWPFDGAFEELVATQRIVFVETYPGDVYSQIELPSKSKWRKTTQEGRAFAATEILRWLDDHPADCSDELRNFARMGFSASSCGEDQFDAFVGLLGMLDVVDGNRSDGAPTTDKIKRWEGWILGQGDTEIHENLGQQQLKNLVEHVTSEGRVYPSPWHDFFVLLKGLAKEQQVQEKVPVPLILGGSGESNSAKRNRLLAQINYAARHGFLDEVDVFLRKISNSEWHTCHPEQLNQPGSLELMAQDNAREQRLLDGGRQVFCEMIALDDSLRDCKAFCEEFFVFWLLHENLGSILDQLIKASEDSLRQQERLDLGLEPHMESMLAQQIQDKKATLCKLKLLRTLKEFEKLKGRKSSCGGDVEDFCCEITNGSQDLPI